MALDAARWSIDRATGNIRYDESGTTFDHANTPSYATVIEFHRWLQDLADDASSAGDDELDITDEDPSSRSTDNIITLLGTYNIDDTSAEYLYDGSIIQGDVGVDQVIYDGIVNFGNADVQIQIIQNGAVLASDYWNQSGVGINADSAQGISHRWMIRTHDFVGDGGDIDGRRLIGTTRSFGNTYGEFSINGTSRGNNVLALVDANDLNNETIEGTVSGWTNITNTTEGFVQLDVNGNGSTEDYYSEWNRDTQTINEFYERMKWLTRDGSVSTIYGLNGELFRGITHEIDIDTPTGTFAAFESVSWTGGTGQMLAIDSTTAGTKMWIQLLTGIAPTNNQLITGTGTALVNLTVVDRSALISKPFIGASTGSAIIGAYGVGMETTDVVATDKLFDLTNTQQTPPNNVTFTVSGIIHDEDRVLVAPWDGSSVDNEGNPAITENQLTTTAVLIDGAAVTTIPVTTTIPSDTPATGDIRILLVSGKYREVPYDSYTGTNFTIPSTDFSGDNVAISSNVWIAYIDELAVGATVLATATVSGVTYVIKTDGTTDWSAIGAPAETPGTIFTATGVGSGTGDAYAQSTSANFTGVYNVDRDLVVVVRDGGSTPIKQFISSASFVSSNSTISAIRTSDS